MKNKIFLFISLLSLSMFLHAQSPEAINYQAVARSLGGAPLVNTGVNVKFEIRQGSPAGTAVYSEGHSTTTNAFGLFTAEIGNGTPLAGVFSGINWGSGSYYLYVEVNGDPMGATQLLSVPYALYSKQSANGPQGLPGQNSLIKSTAEPAGVNCVSGGYFIETGLDANNNGVLDALEVQVSYYICNGVDGTNGTNGTNGTDGVGIVSTVDNGDGTFTFNYSDASSFTTSNLTGPAGANGTTYYPGNGIVISNDTIINNGDLDNDPSNELQVLSIVGDTLFLSNGNSVQLPSMSETVTSIQDNGDGTYTYTDELGLQEVINTIDADADATNELQVLSIVGDSLFLSNGNSVQLPSSIGDNWGTDVVNVFGGNISGDGTVGSPIQVTDNDTSSTNELQNLSISGNTINISNGAGASISSTFPTTGDMLYWDGSSWIAQPISAININDADSDPLNEIELPATAILNQVLTWNGSAWVAQNPGAGADNWGSQTAVTDGTSITGDGTAGSPITLAATIPTNTSDLTNDSGFITSPDDADNDPTNEIELPATAGTNDVLTWNGSAWIAQAPGAGADNWGSQTAVTDGTSITGDGTAGSPITLSATIPTNTSELTNDSGFITSPNDADADSTNEIQSLSFSSPNLSISGGNSVDLSSLSGPAYSAGTGIDLTSNIVTNTAPDQTVTLTGSGATSVSGTYPNFTITSTDSVNDADSDPTNEIELPATAGTNDVLTWNGTAWVAQAPVPSTDTDWDISAGVVSNISDNIGIGTSTPSAKLEVTDDILVNSIIIGKGAGNLNGNVVFGEGAFVANSTGTNNTAIGNYALQQNADGGENVALGFGSLGSNTSGYGNVGLGRAALPNTVGGFHNVGVGDQVMYNNSSGFYNVAIGKTAMLNNTTGNRNTTIGVNSDVATGNLSNATAIGADAVVGASNSLVLGNNANVGIGTSTPSAKLDVVGGVKITDGTEGLGKVLTSDAAGNATWQTPSGSTSPWTETGTEIYATDVSKPIGIGLTTPNAQFKVHLQTTGEKGMYIDNAYNGTNSAYGLEVYNNNAFSGIRYGVYSQVNGGGSPSQSGYGGYFSSTVSNTGSINYGIYARAAGGTSNYAGYFADGNVFIQNGLILPTGAANNYVLKSDASGNATWADISTLLPASNDWSTTGNSGTVSGTNFIGTTDAQNLEFRTKNIHYLTLTQTGQIEVLNTGNSVFLGQSAGSADDLTDNQNSFIGAFSGSSTTNGNWNTALGYGSLSDNTTGAGNTAIGRTALSYNTGSWNTGIGTYSLFWGTTGSNNTGVGGYAGQTITTGSNNTFLGYQADASVNNLTNATAIGANATVSQSNSLILGNNAVVGIGTSTPSTASKLNVVGNSNGSTVNVEDNGLKNGSLLYLSSTSTSGTGSNSSHMIYINRSGAQANTSHTSYGLRSNVSSTGPTSTNIAGYFNSTGATTNWAGYFAGGDVYIQNSLVLPTGAANNYVLTSDATGKASWADIASINPPLWKQSGSSGIIYNSGNVGVGMQVPNYLMHIQDSSAAAGVPLMRVEDFTGTLIMEANNNGKLGVGISPSSPRKLDVAGGGIRISEFGASNLDLYKSGTDFLMELGNTPFAIAANGGSIGFRIDDGNADFYLPLGIHDGTEGDKKVFTSDISGYGSWQDLPGVTNFGVYSNVSLPIGATVWTRPDFDVLEHGSNFNLSTDNFVAPADGVYHFDAHVEFDVGGGQGTSILGLFVNGAMTRRNSAQVDNTTSNWLSVHISSDVYLNAGDLVNIQFWHNLGTATTSPGKAYTYFTGHRVN